MPLTFLGSDLVESIRNLGQIPNTGATGSLAANLLRHASEGLRNILLPEIASTREEHFVKRIRVPVVPGTASYRLPRRAMWEKLRDLCFFDGTNRLTISPAAMEALPQLNGTGSLPTRYRIEGNYIVLTPDLDPSYSGFLEMAYYARPGDLVLETAARQVDTVDTVTNTVTFASTIPTDWATETSFDAHSELSGADLRVISLAGVASASQVVFSADIDGSVFGTKPIEVGDWVTLAGEAALPGVPAELHPIVGRVAALHIAESVGDEMKVQLHGSILDTFLKKHLKNLEQRIEGKPWRITGTRGMLGSRRGWRAY